MSSDINIHAFLGINMNLGYRHRDMSAYNDKCQVHEFIHLRNDMIENSTRGLSSWS